MLHRRRHSHFLPGDGQMHIYLFLHFYVSNSRSKSVRCVPACKTKKKFFLFRTVHAMHIIRVI